MEQKSILVVGSLNMDQVVHVPHIPAVGETLLGAGSLRLVAGGKGANQAVAMARTGGKVMMAGRVGSDSFGTQLVQALQADAIDTSLIVKDAEEASGTAFIFSVPDGDNAIVVSPGANARVGQDEEQMTRIFAAFQQASALVLQLEIPLETVQQVTAHAHKL
ncbi:MAG TPA: PfkB family carbohydrate kinase, partial [Ktedonobacteraceae bacterium]|nr:PfkB family carbohydrate kinase [Ktedonobacteraceae bacterium]